MEASTYLVGYEDALCPLFRRYVADRSASRLRDRRQRRSAGSKRQAARPVLLGRAGEWAMPERSSHVCSKRRGRRARLGGRRRSAARRVEGLRVRVPAWAVPQPAGRDLQRVPPRNAPYDHADGSLRPTTLQTFNDEDQHVVERALPRVPRRSPDDDARTRALAKLEDGTLSRATFVHELVTSAKRGAFSSSTMPLPSGSARAQGAPRVAPGTTRNR